MYIIRAVLAAATATVMLNACGTADTRPTQQVPQHSAPAPAADRSPATKTRGPMTMVEAMQVCKYVQRERAIPITCLTTKVEGHPTMVVGFADASGFDVYGDVIVEYVAGPFCVAANSANREAFLVFAVDRPGLMSVYSCETGEITEWFDPQDRRLS